MYSGAVFQNAAGGPVDAFLLVDGIINNAGFIKPFKLVAELSYEDIHRVMNVNFYGTVYLTKAFLPLFLQRPEAHIVNISSMGGFIPFPGQTIYGAPRVAVKFFTKGLYAEWKDTHVLIRDSPYRIGTLRIIPTF